MVIGIIGAGFAGLIAGRRLAKAGHDVTVIEKNRTLGGRLASVELDGVKLDYGVSHLTAGTKAFHSFVDEILEKGMIREWTEEFGFWDGLQVHRVNPNSSPRMNYAASTGIHSIADHLSRLVDLKSSARAGGLTHIGPDRSRKRSWMINLTDFNVFECDAVILATPATEAYGILQTSQDETPARRIIRHIDEVTYERSVALAVTYDREAPAWEGIECESSPAKWISNESTKRESAGKTGLVIQSTTDFYRRTEMMADEKVKELLLNEASEIVDSWLLQPQSSYLHRWKYFTAQNPINEYFMELEMEEAPLALIGDYFGGNSPEDAFLSGYNLAEYWINKYSEVAA